MRERMTYESEEKWRADMTFHLVQLIARAKHAATVLQSPALAPIELAHVAAMADAALAFAKLPPGENIQPPAETLTQAGLF